MKIEKLEVQFSCVDGDCGVQNIGYCCITEGRVCPHLVIEPKESNNLRPEGGQH